MSRAHGFNPWRLLMGTVYHRDNSQYNALHVNVPGLGQGMPCSRVERLGARRRHCFGANDLMDAHFESFGVARSGGSRTPVITVTDLYQPHQDVGDNIDLITAFGLPDVDLKAVILDCTQPFRQQVAGPFNTPSLWRDPHGPRDPGIIPVNQLNYIFDRNVPYGIGPFLPMKSSSDPMTDSPSYQQSGIELILAQLELTTQPLHILSFGSARTIAAAYNRSPACFRMGGL